MAKNRTSAFVDSVSPKQNYVFYEYLRTDSDNEILANQVTTNYTNAFSSKPKTPDLSIVDKLKEMAQNERDKEQNFIKYTFGVNISYDLDYKNTKDFIDAFNSYMQLQNVYEARKMLLMHGFGDKESPQNLKDAYSYFSSYFATVWKKHHTKISNMIKKNIKANPTRDWQDVLSETITQELPNLVEETLLILENVQGDSKLNENEQKQEIAALREISKAINDLGKTSFGKMVISALGLNSISKNLIDAFKQEGINNKNLDLKKMRNVVKKGVAYHEGKGVNITGGNMLELVEYASVKALAKGLKSGKNFEVIHTGSTGMKADNVMIVASGEIDMEQIEKILESNVGSQSREENIAMIDKLQSVLEKGKTSGYIVYSSDKNHFMVKKKDDKYIGETGFSGGSAQKLGLFAPILQRVLQGENKADTLIQGIMQTIPGAIGSQDKGAMEERLAEYFAYFLFDDLDFIGKKSSGGSTLTQIHLMNLDGLYVPLSVLLATYAQALNNEIKNAIVSPQSVAKITISTPSKIKYNYADPNFMPTQGAWGIQREEALNGIKVGLQFLKSLRTILDKM